jgi:hypothetical protein
MIFFYLFKFKIRVNIFPMTSLSVLTVNIFPMTSLSVLTGSRSRKTMRKHLTFYKSDIYRYRITAVLKLKADIITNTTASQIPGGGNVLGVGLTVGGTSF